MLVHVLPLAERYAVKMLPLRTRRRYTGALTPVTVVVVIVPPAVRRRMNCTLPLGVTNTPTNAELAAVVLRIIRPAFALASVLVRLATRPLMVKLVELLVCETRWNESLVPAMSEP